MNLLPHSRRTHCLNSRIVCASLASLFTLSFPDALAQSTSPVQSKARPFGLDIVAPVIAAGSDQASESFQKSALPEFTSYLQKVLQQKVGIDSSDFVGLGRLTPEPSWISS